MGDLIGEELEKSKDRPPPPFLNITLSVYIYIVVYAFRNKVLKFSCYLIVNIPMYLVPEIL